MNERQELVLLGARPDLALEALRWTEDACARAGLGASRTRELAAAVIEAVNNSLEHGYALGPGDVSLALEAGADRIVVRVSDHGTGLPLGPCTDEPAPLAARGRGSWIMQRACDEVRHEFEPGLQSVVLVKHRDGTAITASGDST